MATRRTVLSAGLTVGGALALAGIYLTAMGQGTRTREAIRSRDVG